MIHSTRLTWKRDLRRRWSGFIRVLLKDFDWHWAAATFRKTPSLASNRSSHLDRRTAPLMQSLRRKALHECIEVFSLRPFSLRGAAISLGSTTSQPLPRDWERVYHLLGCWPVSDQEEGWAKILSQIYISLHASLANNPTTSISCIHMAYNHKDTQA